MVAAAGGVAVEIARDGDGAALGLSIHVDEIVTKIQMDGTEMMRVRLRLRAVGKAEQVTLTSDDGPLEWNGYVVTYVDAWNGSVKLRVARGVARP